VAAQLTSGRIRPGWRRALVAGALGLTMAATAACGGGSGGGDGDGPVTLRFSWWGSDSRHEYTQQLIKQYEAANPGVNIEPSFTGWSDYWDKLATATAGGNAPDIMQQESRYVREYADRGALLDLGEYMPEVIDDSALDQNVMPTGQVDGHTWAIPTGINAFSVVADPKIFADAGVPMPDDETWTWDQMVETAAQISEANGGEPYGMQTAGYNEQNFAIFARQRGESLYSEDGGPGFSRQTLIDWWSLVVAARDTGAAPEASLSVEIQAGGPDQSLLATNNGAMGFWWTNQLSTLTASAGRELELLRFPGESTQQQSGMYFKPAMFWSVSSETEHPEEAAKFVNYLINSPEAAELLLSDRGLPVNTELRKQIVDQLEPADQKAAAFLEEIEPSLQEPPPLPPQGAGEVQQIMQQLTEQVLFNQISVQEAADQFMSRLETATT
jgi:multiple sugar transport system substrate-binding protein